MSTKRQDDRARLFLQEMGLGPLWTPRDAPVSERGAVRAQDVRQEERQGESALPVPRESAGWFESELENNAGKPAGDGTRPVSLPERYAPERIAVMDWETLRDTVSGCVKCRLCEGRTKTVFGTGDDKATWLFIGEGPGRNEDQQGEPFIGPAGRLLDNMLRALGVQRGQNAYIANVVKCRPTDPNGRDRPPAPEEAAACLPYLQRQIALIRPAVLVALGKTAAISLLGIDADTPVGSLRGKVHRYGDLPLIVTYHPAYLLRRLPDKGKVWRDLCLAAEAHRGEHSPATYR